MNEIFTRRSIRKYTEQPITDEDILTLIKAGMAAPSAYNEQPWAFVVIKSKETLNLITEFHPHSKMLTQAACAILLCADKNKISEHDVTQQFWVQDCAAATQNILLQAESMGIGSVWLGVYPRQNDIDKLKILFALPENIIPFSIISLGYPAIDTKMVDRFDEGKIHFEKW